MKILRANVSRAFRQGPFQIRRLRPGLVLGPAADPAFGPLSVIDHAQLGVGTFVGMHKHINDEIFSYLWRGSMVHEDSDGHKVALSPNRLMLMNAGRGFWHEESVPGAPVEMLQIFIRPREADLPARVQFFDRPQPAADGAWHLLAGPEESAAPLKIRQEVQVYDAHLAAGQEAIVPPHAGLTPWLYVMDGTVQVGSDRLTKGEAILATDGSAIRATEPTTLMLFLVNLAAPASRAGTISGA